MKSSEKSIDFATVISRLPLWFCHVVARQSWVNYFIFLFFFYFIEIFFLLLKSIKKMICLCVWMLSHFSHVQLFVTPWTVACQVSLSVGFFQEEYWSGLQCVNLCCRASWFSYTFIHIYILFHIIFHYGLSQDIEIPVLYVGTCYWSILC